MVVAGLSAAPSAAERKCHLPPAANSIMAAGQPLSCMQIIEGKQQHHNLAPVKYHARQIVVEVFINNRKCLALVDTGASLSLIEESFVTVPISQAEEQVAAGTVGNQAINLSQVAQQYFAIRDVHENQYVKIHEFYVIKKLGLGKIHAIFGLDLILNENFNISTDDKILSLKLAGKEIPLFLPKHDMVVSIDSIPIEKAVDKKFDAKIDTDIAVLPSSSLDVRLAVK